MPVAARRETIARRGHDVCARNERPRAKRETLPERRVVRALHAAVMMPARERDPARASCRVVKFVRQRDAMRMAVVPSRAVSPCPSASPCPRIKTGLGR